MATSLSAEATVLLQTLADEVSIVQQFVDLLKLEQAALTNGTTDDLPALAEKKNRFAAHLNNLAAQRNAALKALGHGIDRVGVEAWCEKHPGEKNAENAWSSILSLAKEARELNRVNGELIQIRMQYNAKALEALQGGGNPLDLYGPDGQSTKSGTRRIHDAV